MLQRPLLSNLFFFNDTATTEIYTLSLHDALPILLISVSRIVFISVGPARPKMPFIKSEKRRQGKKCADTDFQKIVAQYGTTEVLDPGGTAFSDPTLISLASGFETATKDRKSTRLNSSHSQISYAVFCL